MSGEAVGTYPISPPDEWTSGPFGYGSQDTDEIVGATVTAIHVDPTTTEDGYGDTWLGGNQRLYLTTDTGIWCLATAGDCCSESWWADIYSPKQVIGGKITEVRTIPLEVPDDDRGRQEVDAAYGIGIRTTRGEGKFVYRNSSNGYYGGWCNLLPVDAVPPSAVEITEDWSA